MQGDAFSVDYYITRTIRRFSLCSNPRLLCGDAFQRHILHAKSIPFLNTLPYGAIPNGQHGEVVAHKLMDGLRHVFNHLLAIIA